MIEKLKAQKRIVGAIIITTCFLLSGFSFLNIGYESSGVTALCLAIFIISYYIVIALFAKRTFPIIDKLFLVKYELYLFIAFLGAIFLIAAIESTPSDITTSMFLTIIGIIILLHTYIELSRGKKGLTGFYAYRDFGYWGIHIRIVTVLLIVIVNYNDEPLLDIFGSIWLASWFAAGIWWLVKQIKFILNLKKEKKQTELLHLKSQVNPHFFFNMLNNLYALVDEDSEKAKKLILSLSDLMRYSIYEGEKDLVPLKEEVDYIQNYLELHRMRYHKEIDIQFSNNIENTDIEIMPLIFIILVENAFKHGVEKLRKDAFVHISLKEDMNQIEFKIKNNFDIEEGKDQKGIGLSNLRRRLELVYPKNHELTIDISDDIYHAHLSLQLK